MAAGAERVCILNRTEGRALAAVEHLGLFSPGVAFDTAPLTPQAMAWEAPGCDLVVNCLGSGGKPAVQAFDLGPLPAHALWVDINYWMADPPQQDACASRGLRFVDGMGMLIHQGALSFELFTGHPIDPAELRGILGAASQ